MPSEAPIPSEVLAGAIKNQGQSQVPPMPSEAADAVGGAAEATERAAETMRCVGSAAEASEKPQRQ